jgi:serine phosphatase RsbU (regulator of sigma subunit)
MFWHVSIAQDYCIDSILKDIRKNKINEMVADKAMSLSYDKIVNNLNTCLFIFENLNDKNIYAKQPVKLGELKENLALVYYLKGDYIKSSNMHLEAISIFEKLGDKRRKAKAMATFAYESKNRNLKSSFDLLAEAIQILTALNEQNDLSSALDNYGVLFEMNNNIDSAMNYYHKALKIKFSLRDSVGIPYTLNNIAGVYFIKNNISEGLKFMNQSTKIREKLRDYIGMAFNEHTLGELYFSNKEFELAEIHFRKSNYFSKKSSYPDLQGKNLKYISSILAKKNRYDSAYFYFNSFFMIHDSLYNSNNQKQLLEMETIYETEKKSSQIKSLDTDNKIKETELEKKRNTQSFLLIVVGLSLFAGIIVLRAYLQKNRTNKIIVNQKKEIEHQKHIVEEHQRETIDSINYARRIQYALLANDDLLKRNLKEHFVLFKPKDIVSGDFYWATEHNDKFYLAVCDSTGHGVPGAFMSLLNIGFLSEAIKEKNIVQPNEVLNYVRKRLIETIGNNGQDGMDAILLCFDKSSNTITYSAANNEPILMNENEIVELPKDKMPVGKGERTDSFSLHKMEFKKGDVLYLYTDGYADQFGGPKGKKFKYKPLNELLLSNISLPMVDQKEGLMLSFNKWKGNLEQVDDICIIGIRI